jgi:hypothetical protein
MGKASYATNIFLTPFRFHALFFYHVLVIDANKEID